MSGAASLTLPRCRRYLGAASVAIRRFGRQTTGTELVAVPQLPPSRLRTPFLRVRALKARLGWIVQFESGVSNLKPLFSQ